MGSIYKVLGLLAGLSVGAVLGALVLPFEPDFIGASIGAALGLVFAFALFRHVGNKKRAAADAAARAGAPLREFDQALTTLADANQQLRTTSGIPHEVLEKAEGIISGLAELLGRLYARRNDVNAAALSTTIENIAKRHLPDLLDKHTRLTPDMRTRGEAAFSAALDAIAQEVKTVTTMVDAGDLAGAEETANIMVARFGRQNFIN